MIEFYRYDVTIEAGSHRLAYFVKYMLSAVTGFLNGVSLCKVCSPSVLVIAKITLFITSFWYIWLEWSNVMYDCMVCMMSFSSSISEASCRGQCMWDACIKDIMCHNKIYESYWIYIADILFAGYRCGRGVGEAWLSDSFVRKCRFLLSSFHR